MTAPALERLRAGWAARWPEALALWSRYTMLGEPHWCFDEREEAKEHLSGSFAMIRLDDKAVVIGLGQVAKLGLEKFPLEVMGHEIGHHVLCPADVTDQARMLARIRAALPGCESQAPLVANLFADMLINDRLQRSKELDMAGLYRKLGKGCHDPAWLLYMRMYELLWGAPRGALAESAITDALEADARLGARVVRVYAKEWVKGSGRYAALFLRYLEEDKGKALAAILGQGCHGKATGLPAGLSELDDDELDGPVHPADDPLINGDGEGVVDGPGPVEEAGTAKSEEGSLKPRVRHRSPGEYGEILRSLGLPLDPNEAAIQYYRERALPHLIAFPVKQTPPSLEPLPEGLDLWDAGSPLEEVDWFESVLRSPAVVPGVTTVRRLYGDSPGEEPRREPLDLYLGVDCSGSMVNPQHHLSYPVLAGAVMVLSALRAGARVMVTLSGEHPGRAISTEGFIRDEHEALKILTGYLGTGYSFGINRLVEAFAGRTPQDPPAHILIVTDSDIFPMLGSKFKAGGGWAIAREALSKARGGGTYVLHMSGRSGQPVERMERDGWAVHTVAELKDIVAFAREFSRRMWGRLGTGPTLRPDRGFPPFKRARPRTGKP